MNHNFRYSFLLIFLVQAFVGRAQTDSTAKAGAVRADTAVRPQSDTSGRHQLAIFLPLYLDSAFDATGNYRYDKNFPKFINPGLEFYEGAALALDSLEENDARLDVRIYDTRSASQSLTQVLASPEFERTELIIGQVASGGEMQQLAAVAAHKNIPFINVNFPNDGGITNNPSLVILNSTLRTHCEGIYRFLQRNYPTKPLVFFRKKGVQEDRLRGYFSDIEKSTASVPLKIKYVTLDDNFDASAVTLYLDSTTQTICIAGSLDDVFASRLCGMLSYLKSYRTSLIGMPTWDNMDFSRPEFAGEEIVYSTPFYINPADSLVKQIQQNFKAKFYSRPSDMVFRGYECVYRFGSLLLLHGSALGGSIGEKKYKVFTDFNIEPVFLNRQSMTLDYFENKKLYFIRKLDGNVTTVN
jgi:hypothetical protein